MNKIRDFFKNKIVRIILAIIAVPLIGFILLNLTFIFDALYQGIVRRIVGQFLPLGPDSNLYWFPPLMHGSFVVIIGLISWLVLRLKIPTIIKAIYLVVPLAVIFVTIGMFLYHWPIAVYLIGGLIVAGILYYLYRMKLSWIYYYATILVAAALAIFTLAGGEI